MNKKHVRSMTYIWLFEIFAIPAIFEFVFQFTFQTCYTWPEIILQYFVWITFYQVFILAFFRLKDAEQIEGLYNLLQTYDHCLIYLSQPENVKLDINNTQALKKAKCELKKLQKVWDENLSLIHPFTKENLDSAIEEIKDNNAEQAIFNIKMHKLECENLLKRKQLVFSQSIVLRLFKFNKNER